MTKAPTNIGASVRARLLRFAQDHLDDFQSVMTRFANERLLYRLSASLQAPRFVLNGATLFTAWLGQPHRATRDIDLLGFGDDDEAQIREVFQALLAMPMHDGVTLEDSITTSPIREDQRYGGLRLAGRFDLRLQRGSDQTAPVASLPEEGRPAAHPGLPRDRRDGRPLRRRAAPCRRHGHRLRAPLATRRPLVLTSQALHDLTREGARPLGDKPPSNQTQVKTVCLRGAPTSVVLRSTASSEATSRAATSAPHSTPGRRLGAGNGLRRPVSRSANNHCQWSAGWKPRRDSTGLPSVLALSPRPSAIQVADSIMRASR